MRLLLLLVALSACQRTPPPDPSPAAGAADTSAPAPAAPSALAGAPDYLVRGIAPSHLAAADAYVDGSGLQADFEARLRGTLAMRLPPSLLPVAHAWQARYLSSGATRGAFARLLAAHLTEAELRGLATTGLPPDTTGFDARLAAVVAGSRVLGGYLVAQRSAALEEMLRVAARERAGAAEAGAGAVPSPGSGAP